MTIDTSNRPEPGKLPELPDAPNAGSSFEASRSGDLAGAIVARMFYQRERLANTLHYRLRRTAEAMDRACMKLERGDRGFIMTVDNYLHEMPSLLVALSDSTDALTDARDLAETPITHSAAIDRQLRLAADLLDREVERMGLKGAHPQAIELRKIGAELIANERDALRRLRRVAEAKRELEHEKRVARPLGKLERDHLTAGLASPVTIYRGGNKGKAMDSLIERGFMVEDEVQASAISPKRYVLTAEGRNAAAKLA